MTAALPRWRPLLLVALLHVLVGGAAAAAAPVRARDLLPLLPRRLAWQLMGATVHSAVDLLPSFVAAVAPGGPAAAWRGACFAENQAVLSLTTPGSGGAPGRNGTAGGLNSTTSGLGGAVLRLKTASPQSWTCMDLYVFATPYRIAWDYYMRSNENHTFEIKAWEEAAEMEYVKQHGIAIFLMPSGMLGTLLSLIDVIPLFSNTGWGQDANLAFLQKHMPSTTTTKPPHSRRTFADVVRDGRPMAAQEGSGFGGRGGGRAAAGFNPGFNPGFNQGFGGRGGGRGRFPPRGRGRGHGGPGRYGHGFNGGYQSYGRGGGWYNAGQRGRGASDSGRSHHQPALSATDHAGHPTNSQMRGCPPNAQQAGGQFDAVAEGQGHTAMVHGSAPNLLHGTVANPATATATQATGSLVHSGPAAATTTTTTSAATTSTDAQKMATAPPSNNPIMPSDVPESLVQGTQKSKGKPYCYRCHTKGHTISVCTTVLSCDICYGDHVTKVCPNLKNMQTTAIPCGYAVEGLGFYFIPVAENPKMINSDDKTVVVRVLEGSLTADQLAVELDKLLPGKNKWVIEEKGNDAFTTNFPSSDILNHMVNWGPMDTKTVKGKIRFEKGVENDVYKYEIDKVWVQFRGLPKELRKFPIIWAIGSILGVPRAVDTKFIEKHGRARLKVAVLNPDLIPDLVDVVIGDFVYELQFRVEKDVYNGEPQVIDMDSTMDEDKPAEEKERENMDEDGKKGDEEQADQAKGKQPPASGKVEGQHRTVGDIQHTTEDGVTPAAAGKKPVVVLTQSGVTPNGAAQWKANLMPNPDSGILNKSLNGGSVSPVRASKRNATTSDQDLLEKATKLKARKNLDSSSKGPFQGNPLAPPMGKTAAA